MAVGHVDNQQDPSVVDEAVAGRTLVVRSVTVRFAGIAALTDVSLSVRRGEIVGLIGPNGAGKTTMLNVLSGFQRASDGTVSIDGTDITREPAHRMARLGIARTFQAVRSFPELTTAENVLTGALAGGGRVRECTRRAAIIVDQMGLGGWADQPARSLPYGVQRLLGIARAAATQPSFLLLDEPAAGLHEGESVALRSRLAGLRDVLGCGMLLVEHDMALVMSLCDRVHVLDAGRTVAEGAPFAIRHHPDVQRAYLGTRTESDADGH